MSRIQKQFTELKRAGIRGFIPFITAGDPDLATTELLLVELASAGADIIELGIPFSDPVADGEVIQRASERALRNGVTLSDALDCVTRVRHRIDTPIVLFSYFNPLLQFGEERIGHSAKAAGIDGVLVTDLIPEEAQSWVEQLYQNNLDPIFLVAPTTSDERLARVAQQARGFIYAISRTGVTGARDSLPDDLPALLRRARAVTKLPLAVGFGISQPGHVSVLGGLADAAVIGSALVAEIENATATDSSSAAIDRAATALAARIHSLKHAAQSGLSKREVAP